MRLLGAVGILAWLVSAAGAQALLARVAAADVLPLLAALCCVVGEYGMRIVNWRGTLRVMGAPACGLRRVAGVYFYSSLLGQIVPSSLGTDALRVALAQRALGGSAGTYTASLLVLNAQTLFSGMLLTTAAFATLLLQHRLPEPFVFTLPVVASVAIVIPLVHILLRRHRDWVVMGLRRIRAPRLRRLRHALRRLVDALLVFERSSARGAGGVLVSAMMAVIFQSGLFLCTALALGVSMPLMAWLAVPPLMAMAAILPLSVLGFGVHQGAVALVMVGFGVPLEGALAVGLLAMGLATSFLVVAGLAAMTDWRSADAAYAAG